MASLARFYGWGIAELEHADAVLTHRYWRAIEILEAREVLSDSWVARSPYFKKHYFERAHYKLHNMAFPFTHEKKEISTAEFAKMIGLGVKSPHGRK